MLTIHIHVSVCWLLASTAWGATVGKDDVPAIVKRDFLSKVGKDDVPAIVKRDFLSKVGKDDVPAIVKRDFLSKVGKDDVPAIVKRDFLSNVGKDDVPAIVKRGSFSTVEKDDVPAIVKRDFLSNVGKDDVPAIVKRGSFSTVGKDDGPSKRDFSSVGKNNYQAVVKRGFFSSVKCKLFGSGCEPPEDEFSYGVLFDAGSSSTKLKVYRVSPAESSNALPRLDIIYSERFAPGVDAFVGDEDGLREYLTKILNSAKQNVPENKQESTPIYLFATAGLRFLTSDDATDLVENIKAVFQDSSLSPFLYKPAGVGILSGEEEGVYSWVAANYLLGFFDEDRPDTDAVGVLEMGGGSTQITFVPRNPLYDGEFQVTVRGRTFELYVHSYLQFGIDAINGWVAQILADNNPYEDEVDNPCLLQGDEKKVTLQSGHELTMYGSSDPDSCKAILVTILTPETGIRCEPKPCAIGSVYQPDVDDIHFYATQGFTYAPSTLNVIGEDEVLDLEALEAAASEHCQRSLEESAEAGIKESLGSTTCLMGLYIPTLFTLSYGFPPDTSNIKVTSNIGDSSIDWGLGAMVIELTGNTVSRRRR